MTTSKRLADRKVQRFDKNIKKRGLVPETSTKKKDSYPVGPIVLGFFVFVVIGSCKLICHLNFVKIFVF
ncbi:putative stress-associated endoplasmic reticulum protein [Helianthus anomalus]